MKCKALLSIAPAVSLIALASCGIGGRSRDPRNGEATVESATLSKMTLTSDAFEDGQPIPTKFTCDGTDQSPTLNWGEPPAGTKSFALVIDDPDAPSGTFSHWGVFNIPTSARSIGSGQKFGTKVANDFGKPGYGGPCPPKGHGPHHYHFKLFALDTEKLEVSSGAKVEDVENAAKKHALAKGELIGTYERK